MSNSVIDLTALPAPKVLETPDFESLVTRHKADLVERHPPAAEVIALESEPLVKQIEAFSYREMLFRDRINDAARSNLLAFARGADLDHKGAFYNLKRLPDELDPSYLRRIQLRIASLAGNGTAEQYMLIALTASGNVRDVDVYRTSPGVAVVLWLHDEALRGQTIDEVTAAMNLPNARPLGIDISVTTARPAAIDVIATIWRDADAPIDLVSQVAKAFPATFAAYAKLGRGIPRSWITTRLHTAGVVRVQYPSIDAPAIKPAFAPDQYPVLGHFQLTDGGTE